MGEGVRIRRVGFRDGTDEELAALHAVEHEVEAERRPDRVPQPLEPYMAFARNLPSMFEDHAWVAEAADGTPVASSACWSNAAGDPLLMECDICVRRSHRRLGLAAALLAEMVGVAAEEGRATMTWSTFDAVPAGEAFAASVGGTVARVNRTSEVRVADLDRALLAEWSQGGRGRALGYRLEEIVGPYPPELLADGAAFHHVMQTQPRDALSGGDVLIGPDDVASIDRSLVEAGTERWTLLVRDPSGACVGGTDVTFEPWEPTTALQQNTGIDPTHRGLGLAKWAKAAMLERIVARRPEVVRVRTGNAFSNDAMLSINDRIGFSVISVRTEWQASVDDLRRRLG